MICVVLRYGQRAHPQPLARVGQTGAVGVAGMTLGEVTFGVPMGRQAGAARRGRAVIACAAEVVTHFNPYQTSRVFTRSLSHSARTRTRSAHSLRTFAHARTAHRPTIASLAHSTSCARTHSPGTHALRTFLCLLLLFCCYRVVHRYVCPRRYKYTTTSHDR